MSRNASQGSTTSASGSTPRSQIRVKRRITHTKSRNGCLTCKSRRVKCDEEQPVCGACSVRGDECVFPCPRSPRVETRRSPRPSIETSSHHVAHSVMLPGVNADHINPLNFNVPPKRPSNPGELTGCLNMQDLNLLKHYILHTSQSLSLNPRKTLVWERVIPDLATKNPFLMHLLLALAGLDIMTSEIPASSRSTNTQNLDLPSFNESINSRSLASDEIELEALVEHHQKGLQGLQETLAAAGDHNAEPLFAGSMLIVAFAFASLGIRTLDPSSQTSRQSSTSNSAFISNFQISDIPQIHWLRLLRGVGSIVEQSWDTLKLSRLRSLLLYSNANDDWKRLGPEPTLENGLLTKGLSESLLQFALGARRAISRLKECLSSQQATGSVHGDIPGSEPTSHLSPETNARPQLDSIFAAQDQTIDVVEQMYMRTIYLIMLPQIESSSTDRAMQAEIEEAAVSSWPHLVPETFISSLDLENSPDLSTALSFAILGHLYLLIALLDDLWYLGGRCHVEINKINTVVAQFGNPALTELMAWPVKVVSLQTKTRIQ
ncbi:hypothetical protein N7493_008444 [Penicillium malachiteum]|uniref:Zn(2)-C6 fungal-type domain-containing protein n=1 Tax=Penicillium malachiteum TaxID=1324776 RepID=A0AAD6MTT5_9EURO|nr:hypothetical protein N7493_008444 [Penicillium malachiteum]